jgi:hypothetical protein
MIQRVNSALPCADAGPFSAEKSPKPSLQKLRRAMMGDQRPNRVGKINTFAPLGATQCAVLHINHRSRSPQSP